MNKHLYKYLTLLCCACIEVMISGGFVARAASSSVSCTGSDATVSLAAGGQVPCSYQALAGYHPNHDGGPWVNVDLLHDTLADLRALHAGTSSQTVVPNGPALKPLDLVHAQICLSDPDVPYNQCPNNCPDNTSYGYRLNTKLIPLLSQGLANVRRAGLKLVLRFTYNWPCSGSSQSETASTACSSGAERDAPIGVILDHMRQLAPVIQKNSDVIYALQAGFIGQWGEWHDSTEGNDNKQVHNVFLDQFTQLFRPDLQLEVRRPYVVLDYAFHRFANPDDAHVLATELGMHDDFFGSDLNDAGTFTAETSADPDPTPYSTCDLRHAAALVAAHYTMTAETTATYDFSDPVPCGNDVPKPPDFAGFAAAYSLSTIQLAFAQSVWQNWLDTGFYDTVLNSVGPHISLRSATFTASASGAIRLALTLHNIGWASIPNSRSLRLYVAPLGASETAKPDALELSRPLSIDMSDVKAGQDLSTAVDFPAGSNLPPGTYGVYLYSPDPSPRLALDPRYALSLENKGVPDPRTGLNRIAFVTVEP